MLFSSVPYRAAAGALVLLVLLAGPARAQWLGSFSLDNGYNSNAFGLASGGAASVTGIGGAFGYVPADAEWSAVYAGSYVLVPQYPDQQYAMHGLTLSWALPADGERSFQLSAATAATARFGRESYALYNFWQGAAQTGMKYAFAENLVARADYRFRARAYPSFTSLGFLEHAPSLGASLTLVTNTSIHADLFYGRKQFVTGGVSASTGMMSAGAAPINGLGIEGGGPWGGGNGNGNGNGGGYGSGMHAGGAASAPILAYDVPSLSQAGLRVSIGQALAEGLGLGLKYQRRWNLDGDMHAIVAGVITGGGDDELLDDPFSYSGDEISTTLTAVLPWSVTMKATLSTQSKSYPYAASLDAVLAGPDRHDRRSGASLSAETTFPGAWLVFEGTDLTLSYQYLRNESNSSVFDFSAHAVSLGVEVGW
jgi:hypothetical protein